MSTKKRPAETIDEEASARKRNSKEDTGEEHEEEEEHDEEEEQDDLHSSEVISWQTDRGEYTAEIKIRKSCEYEQVLEVNASIMFGNKSIGTLSGTILPRPSPIFYEMGDSISGELQWFTNLFCNSNGAVTRISTNLEGRDIYMGGFFHIDVVAIEKAHKGQNLGLRLVHETLVFLRGQWNLVVLKSEPLTSSFEDRLGIILSRTHPISNDNEEDSEAVQERNDKIQAAKLKISRHWARLGFQQAGRNADECDACYMTSLTYFGRDESQDAASVAMGNWKTKDEIQSLDIYVAPKKHTPQGADKNLKKLVEEARQRELLVPAELATLLHKIEDLVHQNASIHGSRLLFVLAANAKDTADIALLRTLIRLAGANDINAPDENGNRPLHVAASAMNPVAITQLIASGASRTLRNDKGYTPLRNLEIARQNLADFANTFSFNFVKPIDVNMFVESAFPLMTSNARDELVDGWLSPRMMYMLTITAELASDGIRDDFNSVRFQKNRPTSLEVCCGVCGIRHFDYIPTEVFQRNPEGLFQSFCDGWAIAWEAITNLLQNKQAPTKSQVEREIDRIGTDIRKWNHFVQKGGKIEYALDALFSVTRNVLVDGDDGWEYAVFKDDIEAHPATPFDGAFDVARVKCFGITNGNFREQPKGPYHHNFDDDNDDDY